MGIFGWSLPPGVGSRDLPGEQDSAVELAVQNLLDHPLVFWMEDGHINLYEIDTLSRYFEMSKIAELGCYIWDYDLDDSQNEEAAAEFAAQAYSLRAS